MSFPVGLVRLRVPPGPMIVQCPYWGNTGAILLLDTASVPQQAARNPLTATAACLARWLPARRWVRAPGGRPPA